MLDFGMSKDVHKSGRHRNRIAVLMISYTVDLLRDADFLIVI
jgi:hypothetical protein